MRTMEVATEQPRDIKPNVTSTNQTLGTVSSTNQTLSNSTSTNQTLDTITVANQALGSVTDNGGLVETAEGSVTSPITSPGGGVTNIPVTDYYTIAIMADMIDSPSSVVDNNDMITSFSNPNYQLNDADALNSNLPASHYYHDNGTHIYDEPSNLLTPSDANKTQNSAANSKRRKKYAHVDANAMTSSDSPTLQMTSPDSMTSEEQFSLESGFLSPGERTASMVEIEHNDSDGAGPDNVTDNTTRGRTGQGGGGGFMGYYASLEKSVKARRSSAKAEVDEEEVDVDEDDGKSSGDDSGALSSTTPITPASNASATSGAKNDKSYDDKLKDINSPDSNDSGIQADVRNRGNRPPPAEERGGVQHHRPPQSDDLYAVVDKSKKQPKPAKTPPKEKSPSPEVHDVLPPGWQRCDDDDGAYYWHVKSGTIQRDPPPPPPPEYTAERSISSDSTSKDSSSEAAAAPSGGETPSNGVDATAVEGATNTHLQKFEGHAFKYATESIKSLSQSSGSETACDRPERETEKPIRFAVRSLGWVRIAEEDLTPERSSKAVNKCIVDLSLGRNDINDVVGRWGDGKDLYMDLDSQHLTLIDPQDLSVLNVQPIQSIRVWGVGRDNGRERDFAYVARDRATKRHMCHVFRCDTPARQIANTLRDICKKIMMERSLQSATASVNKMAVSRPTNLPNLQKDTDQSTQELLQKLYKNTSFPTPMEEPKKVLRCHYLGSVQVPRPSGKSSVEVLNGAMEKAYARVPPEKWVFVSVAIAPSTITITEHGREKVLAESRVRFLAFMGIAKRNVKLCSFIMHTAQDQFVAHVFHCEPSAGALCKTIEAACKLRYQKCLDAHPPGMERQQGGQQGKEEVTQAQVHGQGQRIRETLLASAQTMGKGVQSGVATVGKGVQSATKGLQSMLGKINVHEKVNHMLSSRKQPAQSQAKKDPRTGHVYKPCDQSAPPLHLDPPTSAPSGGENIYCDVEPL